MAATPSGWLTPTGPILTARMNVLAGLLWLDFAGLGVPGLSWTTAYVRGDNIKTAETSNGKEHEWFNGCSTSAKRHGERFEIETPLFGAARFQQRQRL